MSGRGSKPTDETDWPQFLPWSQGKMDRERKAMLVGRRLLAVRDQRENGGPGHRLELQLSGRFSSLARFTSASEIAFDLLDLQSDAARPDDPRWEQSLYLGVARGADHEFHRQFLSLWDAAGTTTYDKAAWKRFDMMLQEAGYWR